MICQDQTQASHKQSKCITLVIILSLQPFSIHFFISILYFSSPFPPFVLSPTPKTGRYYRKNKEYTSLSKVEDHCQYFYSSPQKLPVRYVCREQQEKARKKKIILAHRELSRGQELGVQTEVTTCGFLYYTERRTELLNEAQRDSQIPSLPSTTQHHPPIMTERPQHHSSSLKSSHTPWRVLSPSHSPTKQI